MNFLTKPSDYSVLWLAAQCTVLLFEAYRIPHSEAFRITILVNQDITASKSLVIRKSGEEEKRKRISEIFEFEWWNNEHAITPLQPRKKKSLKERFEQPLSRVEKVLRAFGLSKSCATGFPFPLLQGCQSLEPKKKKWRLIPDLNTIKTISLVLHLPFLASLADLTTTVDLFTSSRNLFVTNYGMSFRHETLKIDSRTFQKTWRMN